MTKKDSGLPKEAKKIKLPLHIKHQLLMEAGYKCGNPACHTVITLQIHHIQYVSEKGGNDPSNLLVLCPNCHSMHHEGLIPVQAISLWKGLLVALNQCFDRQGKDMLLFLYKTQNIQIRLSGDGVLAYAGLIGANLVEITQTDISYRSADMRTFVQTSHKLALTQKGILLVESWLTGNEEQFLKLVSGVYPKLDAG